MRRPGLAPSLRLFYALWPDEATRFAVVRDAPWPEDTAFEPIVWHADTRVW